jgi:hypothetical protein
MAALAVVRVDLRIAAEAFQPSDCLLPVSAPIAWHEDCVFAVLTLAIRASPYRRPDRFRGDKKAHLGGGLGSAQGWLESE